jgi:hypothetical protein
MKNLFKKLLIKSTIKPELENTYTPPLHIDDAKRKEWFTTYDIERVNAIRQIKLNGL